MEYLYKEISFLENWVLSQLDWLSKVPQFILDWARENPGAMIALGAFVFLVLIFWIGSRYVIMPKGREGSD